MLPYLDPTNVRLCLKRLFLGLGRDFYQDQTDDGIDDFPWGEHVIGHSAINECCVFI